MEQKDHSLATDPFVVINGGVEVTVRHLDDTAEVVKVRQLPLRRMAQYGSAQGDEGRIIEVVTGQDAAWVDDLTLESQEEIVVLADRLNLDPFLRWSLRRLTANKHLEPLTALVPASASFAPPSAPGAATPRSNSNG